MEPSIQDLARDLDPGMAAFAPAADLEVEIEVEAVDELDDPWFVDDVDAPLPES